MTDWKLVPVTEEMVSAYLLHQRKVCEDADRLPGGAIHTDTVRFACKTGLEAALAAAPRPDSKPAEVENWGDKDAAFWEGHRLGLSDAKPDLSELRALVERMRKAVEKPPEGVVTKWDYYVEGWTDELEALIERMGDGELARLERELAEDNAIAIIESSGVRFGVEDGWLGKSDDDCLFDDALRYLELRDLLERHHEHPDWVRVKEADR